MTRAQEILAIEEEQKRTTDQKRIRNLIARKIIYLREEMREVRNIVDVIRKKISETGEDRFREPRQNREEAFDHVIRSIDVAINMCRRNFILTRPVYQPLVKLLSRFAEVLEEFNKLLLRGTLDTRTHAIVQFEYARKNFNNNMGNVMEVLTGTL